MQDSKKEISVVILTYNSMSLIKDCLNSIFTHNDIGDTLEIIVVDNNSKECDSMFAWIKQTYSDTIKLIRNDKNGGYGQGNNVGVRAASAPIVLIMNPDVRLLEPVFKKVLNTYLNPKVAIVGMKQIIEGAKTAPSVNLIIEDNFILYPYYAFFSVLYSLTISKIINYFDLFCSKNMFIHGSCFFIRKDLFIKAGMFDENIFMYCEEKDLHHRLYSLGTIKNIYLKDLHYKHLIGSRKISFKGATTYLESEIYYAKKHHLRVANMLYYNLYRYRILKILATLKSINTEEYDRMISQIKTYIKNINNE